MSYCKLLKGPFSNSSHVFTGMHLTETYVQWDLGKLSETTVLVTDKIAYSTKL